MDQASMRQHRLIFRGTAPTATFVTLAALALVAGCGVPASQVSGSAASGASGGAVVQVAKSRGAVQCGERGVAPEAMRKMLEGAGMRVQAARCGSDGRMHAAVCGGATGELNVFDIHQDDLARAQALGFAPLASMRDAEVVPCR